MAEERVRIEIAFEGGTILAAQVPLAAGLIYAEPTTLVLARLLAVVVLPSPTPGLVTRMTRRQPRSRAAATTACSSTRSAYCPSPVASSMPSSVKTNPLGSRNDPPTR